MTDNDEEGMIDYPEEEDDVINLEYNNICEGKYEFLTMD